MTNTSGWPGIDRSGFTSTRPARSVGAPAWRRAVTRQRRRPTGSCPPRSRTHSYPRATHRRPSPACSCGRPRRDARDRFARASRSGSGNVASTYGPASSRMMRAEPGSKWRKSRASDCRAISASAPASSTPVGPPPTTTNVSSDLSARRIRLALRAFERHEHAAPDLERVLETLQTRCVGLPLVVAEVRMGRAGSHDQVVVRNLGAVRQVHGALRGLRRDRLRRAGPRRSAAASGSTGWETRCLRATTLRSPPDREAAERRDDCGDRRR